MKILVVDDTRTERMIMTSYLEKLGHEVIVCTDGKAAIDAYKEHSLDLILMDVIMPVMDGYESAKTIRSLDNDWIPIIFLSARVSPDDISAGIDAGGDDYLTKPVDIVVLEAKMKAMQRIAKMRHKLLKTSDELEKTNNELQQLVNVDGLTGIANRRYMDQFLRIEFSRSIRHQHTLSYILTDIDQFKLFNDHYGHLEGDDCLKKIAKALASVCKRSSDLVARYGGEEFAIVLPSTPLDDAVNIAERLRKAVEDLAISHKDSSVSGVCTLSLGVASIMPQQGDQLSTLMSAADGALYQAKESGRNQVVASTRSAS